MDSYVRIQLLTQIFSLPRSFFKLVIDIVVGKERKLLEERLGSEVTLDK